MQQSYKQAAWYALAAILMVLYADFRSLRHTLLAMVALGLGMLQLFGMLGLLGVLAVFGLLFFGGVYGLIAGFRGALQFDYLGGIGGFLRIAIPFVFGVMLVFSGWGSMWKLDKPAVVQVNPS